MSYKHKCVLYPAAYCTLKIETAFDHVYMRVNTQHVWKGVNPYPSLIHHSCVPNPCPRLEGTPCGTVFTDHCCSINSLKQRVSLQLEGRKWAWRAQGLAGVAAPGALLPPATGLFGNAQIQRWWSRSDEWMALRWYSVSEFLCMVRALKYWRSCELNILIRPTVVKQLILTRIKQSLLSMTLLSQLLYSGTISVMHINLND